MVNVFVTVKKKERKEKKNYPTFHILLLKIMSAA